jgi:hypothetical protein
VDSIVAGAATAGPAGVVLGLLIGIKYAPPRRSDRLGGGPSQQQDSQ